MAGYKRLGRYFGAAIVFTVLPIWNLLVVMAFLVFFFYFALLFKGSIRAKACERSFSPTKLPLVLIPNEVLRGQDIIRVKFSDGKEREIPLLNAKNPWQKFSWPLFLCIGTYFAVFSLGSEYITDDERCLKCMKVLRLAGFIMLPLFVYSLAKRSEGLHALATFM